MNGLSRLLRRLEIPILIFLCLFYVGGAYLLGGTLKGGSFAYPLVILGCLFIVYFLLIILFAYRQELEEDTSLDAFIRHHLRWLISLPKREQETVFKGRDSAVIWEKYGAYEVLERKERSIVPVLLAAILLASLLSRVVLVITNPQSVGPRSVKVVLAEEKSMFEGTQEEGVSVRGIERLEEDRYPRSGSSLFFKGLKLTQRALGSVIISPLSLVIAGELILLLFLFLLIHHYRESPLRIMVYSMNPLVLFELYANSRLEILGVGAVLAALYFIISSEPHLRAGEFLKHKSVIREFVGTILLAGSLIINLFVVTILLPIIRRLRLYHLLLFLAIFLGINFLASPGFTNLYDELLQSAERGPYNSFVFTGVFRLIMFGWTFLPKFTLTLPIANLPLLATKVIFIIVLIIYLIKYAFLTEDPLEGLYYSLAAILILSPNLLPWSLLWLIPVLIFMRSWAWLLFSYLVLFAYIPLSTKTLEVYPWITAIEYFPLFAILLVETSLKERQKELHRRLKKDRPRYEQES